MIKIIDKHNILRICDECGNEKILQRVSGLTTLLKKEKHLCGSCSHKGNTNTKGKTITVKSIYQPSKNKVYKFVKMVSKY